MKHRNRLVPKRLLSAFRRRHYSLRSITKPIEEHNPKDSTIATSSVRSPSIPASPSDARRGRPRKVKRIVHFPDSQLTDPSATTQSFRSLENDSFQNNSLVHVSVDSKPRSVSDTQSPQLRQLRPRHPTGSMPQSPGVSTSEYQNKRSDEDWPTPSAKVRRTSKRSSAHHPDEPEPEVNQEDDGPSDQDKSETDGPDGRRYPVRNRRHTAVYQIEYAQHTHTSTRNWLAGTGYDYGSRPRNRKSRHSRGLQHCGSSTSSSGSDSEASSSSIARAPPYRRHTSHTSWHPATSNQLDPDEMRFARRCTKSIIQARSELLPINLKHGEPNVKSMLNDRLLSGTSLADIEPMKIDEAVGFDHVGGHNEHIMALKESIILPMMYPEVFSNFGIDPPRGVLFSGPPGTGKTLLARALANECSRLTSSIVPGANTTGPTRPIAFFMRKGADCLSKWVGESERQLRLLFDQAYRMRPSIIFFDEIDGLAQVRSLKQDQIHSSIVSTLLSLMDGLDNRAEVIVIGATNRPDALDPALRRPGRFDREFVFTLPSEAVRLRILEVHTSKWKPKPDPELLSHLAHVTGNYSGADLKALVTEACLSCLRRQYPQVYESQLKLAINQKYLVVEACDWLRALRLVRPSVDRSEVDVFAIGSSAASNALSTTRRHPLPPFVSHLLDRSLCEIVRLLSGLLNNPWEDLASQQFSAIKLSPGVSASNIVFSGDTSHDLMAAVWHKLELVQVFTLNYANLVAFPSSVGISPEAAVVQLLSAVRRATVANFNQSSSGSPQGVIVYIPQLDQLLRRLPPSLAAYLIEQLDVVVREFSRDDWSHQFYVNTPSVCSEINRAVSQRLRRLLIVSTLANDRTWSTLLEGNNADQPVSLHSNDKMNPAEKLCNGFIGTPTSYPTIGAHPSVPPVLHAMSRVSDSSSEDTISPDHNTEFDSVPSKSWRRLLSRVFQLTDTLHVQISSPSKDSRASLFSTLSTSVRGSVPEQPSVATQRTQRPPTPPPATLETANRAVESRLTADHLAEIEREENQLFRRLRQVLRRVVAHLARHRRFAVFTRPVQVDEAPDYYDVIKQPMDLGTVRDRIDAKQYTNVDDFMKDIELIYYNAMEYNPPNVPRSRDIRSRASEFWDEACLQLEEELHPPDLNDRCKAAIAAQSLRNVQPGAFSRNGPQPTRNSNTVTELAPVTPTSKELPMPQGDRYSRRLHGQPPVLEPSDVEVLESAILRRRSAVGNFDLTQLKEKLGMERNRSPDTSLNGVNSPGPNDTSKPLASSSVCDKTISPDFSPRSSPRLMITRSPDLSSTIHPEKSIDDNAPDLESFFNELVDGTDGWSTDHLLDLHRKLSYAIRRHADIKSGCLKSELEEIFKSVKV